MLTDHAPLELVAAFVAACIAVARFTRLVTHDAWPPMVWARRKAMLWSNDAWRPLWECPFCFATYPGLADLAWAWGSGLDAWWWAANVWFAGIYVAAMIVLRDEPPAED